MPDKVKSKLEEAGYKVTSEDDDGAYYVKQVGDKKAAISIPADFDEENWAITTRFVYEAGTCVDSYGDFPASDLDEVLELNAKFLWGEHDEG